MLQTIAALGTVGFVIFLLLGLYQFKVVTPVDRIKRALGQSSQVNTGEPLSLKERLMRPLLHQLSTILERFIPKRHRGDLSRKLNASGLGNQWSSVEWEALRMGLGILCALITLSIFTILHASILTRMTLGIFGFLIGYVFPDSWLKTKIRQRKREIQQSLPDILDLLTVSVEAGLGFDAALLKVVEKQKGPLSEELLRVLQEIKMGRPRRDALRDLGKRNDDEDLSNVVASLVQADQLGIPIGGVLRNQAKQIRQKRRQRAEEKAQKAPVKIMIPLVFFIFPFIFIIILGPAIIQIFEMFTNY